MIDRATAVAAFLAEEQDGSQEPDALWDEMCRRWPGLTPEEGRRGAAIAAEILAGKIAEENAQAETMADTLRRANGDDAALRAEVAAAVQDWSEAEFREIADGTGIPLDHIRTVMAAIQRGDPLP